MSVPDIGLPSSAPTAVGGAPSLVPSFPLWGLTWRSIVMAIGVGLVVPAPWAGPWFYKWFAEQIALPDGRPLRLAASAADSWPLFLGLGLAAVLGTALQDNGGIFLVFLIEMLLGAWLVKWFVGRLYTDDRQTRLTCEGSYIGFIGWNILLIASFVTVIGWAWVVKYWFRWIADSIRGSFGFQFTGTGLAILWRTLVAGIGFGLIIPIPWVLRWYTEWFVGQFAVGPSGQYL